MNKIIIVVGAIYFIVAIMFSLIPTFGPCREDNLNEINCFIEYWYLHLLSILLIIVGIAGLNFYQRYREEPF